jgi:hypothetical protein
VNLVLYLPVQLVSEQPVTSLGKTFALWGQRFSLGFVIVPHVASADDGTPKVPHHFPVCLLGPQFDRLVRTLPSFVGFQFVIFHV